MTETRADELRLPVKDKAILALALAALCAQDGWIYYYCSSPPGNLLHSLETENEQEIKMGSVGGGSVRWAVRGWCRYLTALGSSLRS